MPIKLFDNDYVSFLVMRLSIDISLIDYVPSMNTNPCTQMSMVEET